MSDFSVIGIDTETYLIVPGLLAPPLVCVSGCPDVKNPGWVLDRKAGLNTLANLLDEPNIHLAIHNAPFDLAVACAEDFDRFFPRVVKALDDGRVHCTKVRDQMLWNATTGLTDENNRGQAVGFSLADVVLRRFGVDLSADKGADGWRLRYGELDGKPVAEWPREAIEYARHDAEWHLKVYEHQEGERVAYVKANFPNDPLADEPGQTRSAFALWLMAIYGVRTDEAAVQKLEADLTAIVSVAEEKLKKAGILRGTSKKNKETGLIDVEWSKDTKLIKSLVEGALGAATPRTEPSANFPEGQVKTDEETLTSTGHPDLLVLAESATDTKMLNVWVPALQGRFRKGNSKTYEQRGLRLPSGWLINPGWDNLKATGRTSCWGPPLQQPPRKGNVRPCVVPRPGHWFLSVDYSFIELVTWAQTCLDLFGKSDMATAIKAGLDPHVDMGVEILRAEGKTTDYAAVNKARKAGEPWAKDARQLAKAANFGLPGGLGAGTFCAYAKATYDVVIEEVKAWEVKAAWKRKWSEADPYFNHVSLLQQGAFGQPFAVVLPRTGFVRGGCTFTSGCNTYFQGLAARGLKEALWRVVKETYLPGTALYGCRQVMELHDEIILEVPADRLRAHEAAARLQVVMIESMQKFTPDVPVKVEPGLMCRWWKEAEPVYGADGVLELWEPS